MADLRLGFANIFGIKGERRIVSGAPSEGRAGMVLEMRWRRRIGAEVGEEFHAAIMPFQPETEGASRSFYSAFPKFMPVKCEKILKIG